MASISSLLNSTGPLNTAATIVDRLIRPRAKCASAVTERLRGRSALEIGGPSSRFRSILPVYDVIVDIDNATFSKETIWEGKLSDEYRPTPSLQGHQYIVDGTDLGKLGSYDALLSSHVLEHIANPIRALREWRRVLKPRGLLVVIVPCGKHTFDHRRRTTTLDHIVQDYEEDVEESDLQHMEEVLATHDLGRDPGVTSREELKKRLERNSHFRAMHHHVFDRNLLADLLDYAGFDVEHIEFKRPYDIIGVATPRDTAR